MWDSLSMSHLYVDLSKEATFNMKSRQKVATVFLVRPSQWPTLKELEDSLGLNCYGIIAMSTTNFEILLQYYCHEEYLEFLECNLGALPG